MLVFTTDQYPLPLTTGHTFPIEKYARLRQRVIEQRLVAESDLRDPPAASLDDLRLVHEAEYVFRAIEGRLSPAEVRELGFPWSRELIDRSRRSVGATIGAAESALRDGIAVNLAGGTHHAFADHGAGYCVFNDVAVAARRLQSRGLVRRVVVVDCDVHQGDGTARIFENDPSLFTFSLHGAKNYPLRKQKSDLDIELEDGATNDVYLEALRGGVELALSRADADFAFYLAGADPYEGDRLGRLKVSKAGLAERDRFVLELLREKRLPVAIAMAGGYAREIDDTVEIQLQTVRQATIIANQYADAR